MKAVGRTGAADQSAFTASLADLAEIDHLRSHFLKAIPVQFVRYSILPRGLADPYLVAQDGTVVGYAGVWKRHYPGRVMEWWFESDIDQSAALKAVAAASGATHIETQTNIPATLATFLSTARGVRPESALFAHQAPPERQAGSAPPGIIRERRPGETDLDGDLVLVDNGRVLACGGYLSHYNPPFVDVFMGTAPDHRRRGFAGRMVAALQTKALGAGFTPAARCRPNNFPSRRALRRGGMVQCGWILTGRLSFKG